MSGNYVGNAPNPVTLSIPSSTGRLLQFAEHVRTDEVIATSTIPYDDTIPQITEGSEFFSLAFTPLQVGSRLVIECRAYFTAPSSAGMNGALFRAGQNDALAAAMAGLFQANAEGMWALGHTLITAALTPITFSIRCSAGGVALRLNSRGAGRLYGGVYRSYLRVQEYSA